jgi:hypothetical protein
MQLESHFMAQHDFRLCSPDIAANGLNKHFYRDRVWIFGTDGNALLAMRASGLRSLPSPVRQLPYGRGAVTVADLSPANFT